MHTAVALIFGRAVNMKNYAAGVLTSPWPAYAGESSLRISNPFVLAEYLQLGPIDRNVSERADQARSPLDNPYIDSSDNWMRHLKNCTYHNYLELHHTLGLTVLT